jgi:amino acid adenylation domain-containing protein
MATPNAPAVAAGAKVLTYAELDQTANQWAHYLRSIGVGRESLVGLYLKRSPAFVMAALAVLKAGAAYLPLDPESPVERISGMMRDAGISALMSSAGLSDRLPSGPWRVVDAGQDAADIARQSSEAPENEVQPGDLAYVIYTSGSTGQPKGVEIEHSSLSNLVAWHNRAFQVTSADRAGFLANLGFDAAVWELWPYLSAGASIHIPEERVRNHAKALRDWILQEEITIAFVATALAERLLDIEWPQKTSLRFLLTGADCLRRRPSARLPFTLVNNYGPTEYTVVATSGVVASGDSESLPSIGRPVDNTTVYIVDQGMGIVPAGEAGELYLGGAGVARGYRNQPELTAERFVSNPFVSGNGNRLYRTGDLVRVLANGEIEFLGRVDEQIKIRGFRIEPNEIIAALNSCPGVQAATVVAREEQGGEKRLIAYLIPDATGALSAGALRARLSSRLPDYMMPSAFVELNSIPTTVNGKVNRAALPPPTTANMLRDEAYVAPEGLVQQRLAALIAPLLHVERVGANDNFFLLGGHSLLGTQLITRISQTFGVDLPLLSLFDHPTLAGMSSEIERLILQKVGAAEESSHTPAEGNQG